MHLPDDIFDDAPKKMCVEMYVDDELCVRGVNDWAQKLGWEGVSLESLVDVKATKVAIKVFSLKTRIAVGASIEGIQGILYMLGRTRKLFFVPLDPSTLLMRVDPSHRAAFESIDCEHEDVRGHAEYTCVRRRLNAKRAIAMLYRKDPNWIFRLWIDPGDVPRLCRLASGITARSARRHSLRGDHLPRFLEEVRRPWRRATPTVVEVRRRGAPRVSLAEPVLFRHHASGVQFPVALRRGLGFKLLTRGDVAAMVNACRGDRDSLSHRSLSALLDAIRSHADSARDILPFIQKTFVVIPTTDLVAHIVRGHGVDTRLLDARQSRAVAHIVTVCGIDTLGAATVVPLLCP